MEKTSKVTNVAGIGTWESKHGLFYKFEVSFDNGDAGQYLSKSQDQNKFVKGQETAYTIEGKEYNGQTYYTIKPVVQQQSFGGGGYKKDPETEKRITRMSVLKVAGDLAISGKIKLDEVIDYAKIFEQYVVEGDAQMKQDNSNDLPF